MCFRVEFSTNYAPIINVVGFRFSKVNESYFLEFVFVLALTGEESSVWDFPAFLEIEPFIGFDIDFFVGATITDPADTRWSFDGPVVLP